LGTKAELRKLGLDLEVTSSWSPVDPEKASRLGVEFSRVFSTSKWLGVKFSRAFSTSSGFESSFL
jgi:hypothetical protein